LQSQYNRERLNAATYTAIADCLEAVYWPGSAAWMRKAAAEETEHARKFSDYLIDRGEFPQTRPLPAVDALREIDATALDTAFRRALALERQNTAAILELYRDALETGDFQTVVFLAWAVEEQTNAEREISDILIELGRCDCSAAYLIFDERRGS
jgi:ferritin